MENMISLIRYLLSIFMMFSCHGVIKYSAIELQKSMRQFIRKNSRAYFIISLRDFSKFSALIEKLQFEACAAGTKLLGFLFLSYQKKVPPILLLVWH